MEPWGSCFRASPLFLWPLIPYEENAEKIIVAEILIISMAPATIKIAPALVAIAGTLSPAHAFVSTVSTIASIYEFDVEKLPRAEDELLLIRRLNPIGPVQLAAVRRITCL